MNNPFEAIDARLSNIESILQEIRQYPTGIEKGTQQDELLTVKQAAEFLSLSIPTVYGLISRREIPVMKRSKRCYFSKSELMNYLKEGRKKTNTEIDVIAQKHITGKGK